MSGASPAVLALLMLASALLAGGGFWTIVRRGDRVRGVLMLIAAAVFLANVLIWTL